MKRTALIHGLAAGLLLSIMFIATLYLLDVKKDDALASTIGNILLMASLSMVFFAIRNVRDKINGGLINFNEAFRAGLLVVLTGTLCYTATKSTYAYLIDQGYPERAIEQTLESEIKNIKSSKEFNEVEKAKKIRDFQSNMNELRTPFAFVVTSVLEFFPMGLVIAILCAVLMKRTAENSSTGSA